MTGLDFNQVMGQAVAHHKAGRLGDAAQLYRKVAAAFPDQPDPLHLLGLALSRVGDSAGALKAVAAAVELNPGHPGYRFSHGNLLLANGQADQAEEAFRMACAAAPGEPDFANQLAIALLEQGRVDEAVRTLEEVRRAHPGFLPALDNLAGALVRAGRSAEARDAAQAALARAPDRPDMLNTLGSALLGLRDYAGAVAVLKPATLRFPEHAMLHYNLGLAYQAQREFVLAEPPLRRAVQLNPRHAPNLVALAAALRELHLLEDSLQYSERAAALAPEDIEVQISLAIAQRDNTMHDAAEATIKAAMERSPTPRLYLLLGTLYWEMGRLDEAKQVLGQALEQMPGWINVHAMLANCERFKSLDHPTAVAMLAAWERPDLEAETRMQVGYALGKVHDDVGEYDRAFGFYRVANDVKRGLLPPVDREHTRRLPGELRRIFTPDLLARLRTGGIATTEPVFVVGMPRSGTSLCEQILAAHPQVFGAGELIKLREVSARGEALVLQRGGPEYPQSIAHLTPDDVAYLADVYLTHVRRRAGARYARIVDKMPVNFRNIGLMAVMFPQARVVHCRRDPMDNCLSIYFQNFGKGHAFANDLTDLGNFYTDYVALMAMWRDIAPLPILDFQYEEVVADPERKARELIDFVGLPWDDACLKFHEVDRAVRTASAWQVRQPIYKRSVARWRRYQANLQPLADALGYDMSRED